MDITKVFVLDTPVAVAWEFLTDPRRVASCLPGAAITGQADDRTHTGTITVKVGPVSATYKGTMRFESLDPVNHTAEVTAAGQDLRGKGGADMKMTSRLVEVAPGRTEVTVVTRVNVVGMLAQFGRGMIQYVSDQMFQKFVDAMRAQLERPASAADAQADPGTADAATPAQAGGPDQAASPATPPVDVIALGSSAIGRSLLRLIKRPKVLFGAGVLLGVMSGYRMLGRRGRRRRG